MALTLAASLLVARSESRNAEQDFTAVSENHLLILQNGWDQYLNKLVALRAFFEASDDVTRSEFDLFTTRLLKGHAAIQNFAWVPRVMRAQRSAYERAAVRDGFPGYQIMTSPKHGTIVPAPEQDEYLPIYYSSLPKTNRVYGLDLRSTIAEKIDRARDLDQLSCVPNWVLHSAEGVTRGILFSLPVYRRGFANGTLEERRRNLMGFVHGSFLLTEMVAHTLNANITPQGIDVHLFAADAGANDLPLYVHGSRLRVRQAEPETRGALEAGRHWTGDIKAGDERWTVLTTALSPGPLAAHHDRAWMVLAAGLMVTLLVVAYILATHHHARRLLAANRKVAELARLDPLTGLANRRYFFEHLAIAFADYQRGGSPFAVLYFDLDHFKDVNDTLGHPLGDQLLRQVAERVKGIVRSTDVVARFGGDEFAVLQKNVFALEGVQTLAAKIADTVAVPLVLDGNEIHITASIGIVQSSEQTTDPETSMIQADLALYRAKENGRNRFHLHSADLDRQVHERVTIADELRLALARDELQLHYQPQVEIASGRIIGMEALMRWKHPRRGFVMPSAFIPVAERTGLILSLGEWAFEESCRQLGVWLEQGIAPEVVAVNFSAAQFKFGCELEHDIEQSLARYRIPHGKMEMELTESVLMEVTEQDKTTLERLHEFGLRVAIDDFGTGYSSLNYLTSYQVNRLKMAQEIVFGVTSDPRNATVVRAAIRLAGELAIDFIAEGVETAAQADFLAAAGCRYAQGYYFSRPLEAQQASALLRRGFIRPAGTSPSLVDATAA